MEVKKAPKASLEGRKNLFRQIGLIGALLVILASFEYKTYEKTISALAETNTVILEEEMIPITSETPPPPPEQPQVQMISDDIIIVDDDVEITTDLIISTEDDSSLGVEIREYVEGRQEVFEEEEEEIPFVMVEERPRFQGGDENAFTAWVGERLVYPEIAKENGVQGRVYLQFRVNTDGSVSDVTVLRGVDPSLDREAVRVVSQSPKWTPGRQRDKPVRVVFTFPVIFQLR